MQNSTTRNYSPGDRILHYVTSIPAHVFFDDAFEVSDENDEEVVVNMFVKDLMVTIDKAATEVHSTEYQMKPPKKFPTPYGGRLVWTLPGKTKMIVHLKDKDKIRHKKRWSQVSEVVCSLCSTIPVYEPDSQSSVSHKNWRFSPVHND
jgi:hypothetical protein